MHGRAADDLVVTAAASAETVRALVLAHGRDACCYQVLDPGIEHWLAADGGAAVGFVRSGRTWIAAGGPVAAPGRAGTAAQEFAAAAAAAGARAVWFLAEEPLRDSLPASAAWLAVGAQPVWSPAALDREFCEHRSLRMQRRRAANKGVVVREWTGGEAAGSLDLARCLLFWLRTRRAPPLRLLAGPTLLPELRDRRVFVASRGGVAAAYLLLTPIAARGGWLVEQIVRGEASCNGISEALLAAVAAALAGERAAMLTLGCVPLSHRSGLPRGSGAMVRTLAWARWLGRIWYDFDGVDTFKAKFRPQAWEPLFLAAAGSLHWRDLLALARAEAGGSVVAFAVAALLRRRVRKDRGSRREVAAARPAP